MSKKIIIVGAGIGGLSVAARLASRGYTVEVYEKLAEYSCGRLAVSDKYLCKPKKII